MYIHPLVPYTDARDVSFWSGCNWLLLLLLLLVLLLSVDLSVFPSRATLYPRPPPLLLSLHAGQ